ncbi:sensory neuron membrane protein 2-like [Neocloeon triangulifer]|uniref:sensory neuron membrane protein 2-like n=1 Tax=Neocloeon triangulifer TaxID=2078957 RepID=UPI00286F0085|nr:sensory neuron membrane protein 2-like [Neocloeon triangulifer]
MCTKLVIAGSVSGIGIVLVALGAGLGWGLFPGVIESEITKNLILSMGSASYENWVKLPQPMEFKVYIMEVENPDEVHAGAKPKMKETGPFVYLETKEKENVVFSEDGETVEFEQRTFFAFSPELSGALSENQEVTVLNAALMGMMLTPEADDAAGISIGLAAGYQFLFDNPETVFTTVKVRDLLFDGVLVRCDDSSSDLSWAAVCFGLSTQELPPALRYDPESGNYFYSFFNHKNGKTDGHFKVSTGKSDILKIGEILEWENSAVLPYWSGPECNVIRGSDATIFPPFKTRDTKVYVFTTDLCRSIYLSYDKDIDHEGIYGYRYVVDEDQLGNVTDQPDNYCFCPPNGACLHRGAMDLTTCFNGPVILTLPHFYQAPDYEKLVEGMRPNKEDHQIYLDMEMNSGAPLSAGRRVQFNMMIKPVRRFGITKDLPVAVVPLLWVNEALTLNEENTNMLREALINNLIIVDGVRWGLVGAGAAAFVAGAALFFVWRGSSKKSGGRRHS